MQKTIIDVQFRQNMNFLFQNILTFYCLNEKKNDVDKAKTSYDLTITVTLLTVNRAHRLRKIPYYMAESVFAMRLVNLRPVPCHTDQNFEEKAHFRALNLFTSEKRLKLSYKTSINLEDLDFDFVLQHFKLCLFVNEGDEETNL